MEFDVSIDPQRLRMDDIYAMLRRAYWCEGIRRDILETAFRHSLASGAYDRASGRQIAVARVVTDWATFAWLCDVFVDEAWRGQGVGKSLIAPLIEHPRLQHLRRFVLATRDAHALYEPFGFAPVIPGRWLEKKAPGAAWREPASGGA